METTSREQIAENVRAAKARRRVTDAEIGAAIGVSRTGATERLAGKTHFRVDELQKLAIFLDTPLEDLIAPAAEATA